MKLFRLNDKQKINEDTYQVYDKLNFRYLRTSNFQLDSQKNRILGANENYWNIINKPLSYKYDLIRFKRS